MDVKRCLRVSMLLWCAPLHAAITGPPIVDNNYNLDLRQGPIIGSAKQVALGGAYIGVAEGITGLNSNAAAVAFRPERSKTKFDWDWTAGINDLKSNDFDNNGNTPPIYVGHRIRSLGLMGQYGPWGIGLLSQAEILDLKEFNGDQNEYVLSATSFVLGRQLADRQWTLGFGLRATMIKLRSDPLDASLGKISAVGWEIGTVWNPQCGPFRFGADYSSEIRSDQSLNHTSSNPVTVNGFIVPHQAILPARLGVGVSYATASAPFWKNHKLLMASDVVFTAPSDNAVGIESVLYQIKQPIGTRTTTSPRLGAELETWPGRLRLRGGGYYEPSNYENVSGRTHITAGFEVRLFHTRIWGEHDWGLTYAVDSAHNYLNNLISVGFWYF